MSDKKTLREKLEDLKKTMKNNGLGGPGSVKAGAVLPNKSTLSKPGNNSLATKMGMPGLKQGSKKNPIKSAEQTQNKDIKDLKMKEAQAALKAKAPEMVKFEKNGQWSLNKGKVVELRPDYNAQKKREARAEAKAKGKDPLHQPAKNFKHLETEEGAKLTGGRKGWYAKDKGVSEAGAHQRMHNPDDPSFFLEGGRAKAKHKEVLANLKAQKKPKLAKQDIVKFEKNGQWSLRKDSADPKLAPKDRKVKELQRQIDAGTYKPDASKIAEAMLKPKVKKMEQPSHMSYDDAPDSVIDGTTINEVEDRGSDINVASASRPGADVEKSSYKGYDEKDNARRKAKNLSTETGVKGMPRVKQYGNSASVQATRQAAKDKAKSKKMPVKRIKDLDPKVMQELRDKYEKKGKS